MIGRFGEFTLLEEVGESELTDSYRAQHDVQGGPLFLKRYRRLDPSFLPALGQRCEVLMSVQHPNLAPHLGHGELGGVVFTVSPWLEGIDLQQFIDSLRERRVALRLEAVLYIVREMARAVGQTKAASGAGARVHAQLTRAAGSSRRWTRSVSGSPSDRALLRESDTPASGRSSSSTPRSGCTIMDQDQGAPAPRPAQTRPSGMEDEA